MSPWSAGVGQGGSAITSERLADYAVQYATQNVIELFGFKMVLPDEIKDALSPFKRRTY